MGGTTSTDARIRVVIADTTFLKSAMVRHRLENDGFDVVATPADAVIDEVRFRQPDAAILGQGVLDSKGAGTLDAIRAASPTTKLIVVNPSGTAPSEGADGYLEEQASVETLAGLLIDLCGEPTIVLPEVTDEAAETVPVAAVLGESSTRADSPRRNSRALAGRIVIAFGAGLILVSLIALLGSAGGGQPTTPAAVGSPSIGAGVEAGSTPTSLDKAYATLDELVAALGAGNYVEAKVDAGLLMDLRQQAQGEGFALLAIDAAITDALTPLASTIAPRVVAMMEDILGALWPMVQQPPSTGGGNIIMSGGTSTGSSTGSGIGSGTSSGTGGASTGGGGTDTFPGQGSHAGWTHKPPKGGWHGDKP